MTRTRVLVADSLAIFRSAVRALLARESDFEVVEAADLKEVVRGVGDGCPTIALIDLDLPPDGGVAAVTALSERCSTYAIVWSFESTPATVLAAIRAGASGYLHKEITTVGLLRALRGVIQGEAPLSRDLAALMIEAVHGLAQRERASERTAGLSEREREVLELVSRGSRNREIAAALAISELTVKRHIQNILQKLELSSRHAAGSFYRSAFGDEGAVETAKTG